MAIAYGSMSLPIYQADPNHPNPFDKEPSSATPIVGGRHFVGTVWEPCDEAVLAIETHIRLLDSRLYSAQSDAVRCEAPLTVLSLALPDPSPRDRFLSLRRSRMFHMHPSAGQTSGAPQHFFREEVCNEVVL